jgi:aryl sulfotransferase
LDKEIEMSNGLKHYDHFAWDNARWDGFEFRPDDILVCTSYKAGTTWTQMICALLIFQKTEFDHPLAEISPWMDIKSSPIQEIQELYNQQEHRRFIKTHTPLDGLPWQEDITYLTVVRDPRDIYISMINHLKNSNPESEAIFMKEARENGSMPPEPPEDPNELFPMWLNTGSFPWERDGFPFWSVFNHAQSFWDRRDQSNIHLFHYSDMKRDLDGQMRKIAKVLEIEVAEDKWLSLVEAATFSTMKRNADRMAPDTDVKMWKSNSNFFNKGTSGQWKDTLSQESLALFDKTVRERYDHDMLDWLLDK